VSLYELMLEAIYGESLEDFRYALEKADDDTLSKLREILEGLCSNKSQFNNRIFMLTCYTHCEYENRLQV